MMPLAIPCTGARNRFAVHRGPAGIDRPLKIKKSRPLKKALADALEERGYTTLTPVQEAVAAPELIGADLLVSAQTGSGKTVGFGLAIAPALMGEDERFSAAAAPLALVIAPTRELALQVKRELGWLYAKAGAVMASCVGGMDMRDERRALGRGAHVVVATPGRLRDHIMRNSIDLSNLRAVVLDEADEMLDLGFREDLEFILGEAPEQRQTLLFSATVPNSITHLARSYQKDAVRVVTKSETSQHADIEYNAMNVSERDAESAVINTLRFYEAPNAIVFANTRAMVNRLTTRLSNRGFQVVALSGELSQAERTHALQAMRDGRARVCVATDVAARGIDLPNLDLVVHAELPSNHEILLHRSGRTGRAGRKGVSALIITPKIRKKAQRIISMAKLKVEWTNAPSAEAVMARDEARMLDDPSWNEEVAESERETVVNLVERFTGEQIAAAFLRLYRSQHSAPEELAGVDAKPPPRVEFGPSVWFSITGGRDQGAEPRRLLPMLCKAGRISKEDIGAIRVQQDHSFVELREASVAGFLEAVGADMKLEGAVLTRLAETPAGVRSPRPAPAPRDRDRDRGPRPAPRQKERDHAPRPATPPATPPAPAPAPKDQDYAPRPPRAPTPTKGTTKPVEWNDDPAPKARKPKPADRPKKPRHSSASAADLADPSVSQRKPHFSKAGPNKSDRPYKSGDKPKGPPPPASKPSSKKNRLRKAIKTGGKPAGGAGKPRRTKG